MIDDLSGYLLNGGSGEVWEHLCLPALMKITILYGLINIHLLNWSLNGQTKRYNFSGQYMQKPSPG